MVWKPEHINEIIHQLAKIWVSSKQYEAEPVLNEFSQQWIAPVTMTRKLLQLCYSIQYKSAIIMFF